MEGASFGQKAEGAPSLPPVGPDHSSPRTLIVRIVIYIKVQPAAGAILILFNDGGCEFWTES